MRKSDISQSPLRQHAADALRRARKLPVGPARNDLRQLALGLLWLDQKGLAARLLDLESATLKRSVSVDGTAPENAEHGPSGIA
jgi:hypothetical protein